MHSYKRGTVVYSSCRTPRCNVCVPRFTGGSHLSATANSLGFAPMHSYKWWTMVYSSCRTHSRENHIKQGLTILSLDYTQRLTLDGTSQSLGQRHRSSFSLHRYMSREARGHWADFVTLPSRPLPWCGGRVDYVTPPHALARRCSNGGLTTLDT